MAIANSNLQQFHECCKWEFVPLKRSAYNQEIRMKEGLTGIAETTMTSHL